MTITRLLGVESSATREQIHSAYRRLARAYHPDIHPGSAETIVRMATPKSSRSFDRNAALMLVVVAPLVVALLVNVMTGAQVAARPAPFLVC